MKEMTTRDAGIKPKEVMNAKTGMTLDMVLTLLKASTTTTTAETQTTKVKLGATLEIQSTVQSSENQVRPGDTALTYEDL